jgi:hypothetical protein
MSSSEHSMKYSVLYNHCFITNKLQFYCIILPKFILHNVSASYAWMLVFEPQNWLLFYRITGLVKVQLSRYTPWRRLGGERRCSSYSFLNSALDGGEWSASHPGRALPPGKGPPAPIVQEARWAPEPVWTQRLEEKSSASVGDQNPVVQSVVRHYTDWATPAPIGLVILCNRLQYNIAADRRWVTYITAWHTFWRSCIKYKMLSVLNLALAVFEVFSEVY